MNTIAEVPQQFAGMADNLEITLTPISGEPMAVDLAELAELEDESTLTAAELDTIEQWATMFQDIPEDKLPTYFYSSVQLLGQLWTADGNENGYFDAVRNLHAFLPEDTDIYGSDQWKAIEFMYYSSQMAQGGNHVFAMMIATSNFTQPDKLAA